MGGRDEVGVVLLGCTGDMSRRGSRDAFHIETMNTIVHGVTAGLRLRVAKPLHTYPGLVSADACCTWRVLMRANECRWVLEECWRVLESAGKRWRAPEKAGDRACERERARKSANERERARTSAKERERAPLGAEER